VARFCVIFLGGLQQRPRLVRLQSRPSPGCSARWDFGAHSVHRIGRDNLLGKRTPEHLVETSQVCLDRARRNVPPMNMIEVVSDLRVTDGGEWAIRSEKISRVLQL
jgi:hypothetical protein